MNTAVYKPVLEEFHGLQNRTYIVTTILVRLGRHDAVHNLPSPSGVFFVLFVLAITVLSLQNRDA